MKQRGFSLVELLVAMAIILTLALVGMPAVSKTIQRSKMEGFMKNSAFLVNMARIEAVKRQVVVVVQLDLVNQQYVAFTDFEDDGEFNPDTSLDPMSTDYLVGAPYLIPTRIFPWAPQDGSPLGANVVSGFSPAADSSDPNQIVFEPTGTIRDVGAYRFGDEVGNFLELRVSPRVSARVELRKWDPDAAEFFAKGEDGKKWRWM